MAILSAVVQNSIEASTTLSTSAKLQLVGDSTGPGNSYYYGTNSTGGRGFTALPTLPVNPVGTTDAQVLSNKVLTTPYIASMYQDTGGTQLMSLPNDASDTLVGLASTQTLTNKTYTHPKLNFISTGFTVDKGYEGDITHESVGEGGVFGEVLYLSSDGYKKALANADATLPAIAYRITTSTGIETLLLRGHVKDSASTYTKGQMLWVSTGTAGAISNTKSTVAGARLQYVGSAISTDTIYFNPNAVYVEVSS